MTTLFTFIKMPYFATRFLLGDNLFVEENKTLLGIFKKRINVCYLHYVVAKIRVFLE